MAKPYRMTPARLAQIRRFQQMGAAARRGRQTAAKQNYHAKRAARRKSVIGTYGRATAVGLQKMVAPGGLVAPIVGLAKNNVPGYNQYQILKSTGHTAGRPGAKQRKNTRKRKIGK